MHIRTNILTKSLLNLLLFCLLLSLKNTESVAQETDRKINIVTTISMIADIVRNVADERANVTALMGEGVDPHLYKPTRSDIATLMTADIIFYNGLLLEGKMTDSLIRIASSGKKVYAVTELMAPEYLLHPKEFQGHPDPHVWMDPLAWIKAVEVVRDKLSEFSPSSRAYYSTNADRYISNLQNLNDYALKALQSIPKNAQVIVTAHDAFQYFGRRYDLEVVGIQGISTESEAGVQDIERIVSLITKRKIKAVFIETTVAARNTQALIEGAEARGHKLIIGGSLFSDAMGKPQTYEGTYIGMIDHNVTTISRSLGGTAPLLGLNSELTRKEVN